MGIDCFQDNHWGRTLIEGFGLQLRTSARNGTVVVSGINRIVTGMIMPLIQTGKKEPAFNLKDQNGKSHKLSDYEGRNVVLYFYPKDDTPGCTKEACDFRDTLPRFKTGKAVILGVSVLDEASKARFAEKYDLNFPLLADEDHEVADKYGAWQKRSLYGREFMGVARTTYLIGPDGKVLRRWDKVKVDGHADEVLEALH